LLKIGLFAVAGAVALINHRKVRAAAKSLPRTVAIEATLVVMALGLAAVLTSSQPAREPQFVRGAQPRTAPILDLQAADLQETLAITPNRPGHAVLFVEVFNTRRPAPAPIVAVSVALSSPATGTSGPIVAQRLTDGRWSAPLTLSTAGGISLDVTVRRSGMTDTASRFEWTVGEGRSSTRQPLVSQVPLAGLLPRLAGAIALLMLGAAGTLALRRRREAIPRERDAIPRDAGSLAKHPSHDELPRPLAGSGSKRGVG
jgi:hypothetical protein